MAMAMEMEMKVPDAIKASSCPNSRLLQSFRAIGVVVDDVPIFWYAMGQESFALASLGKAFAVYKCDKLVPVLVSPQLPHRISALSALPAKHLTMTACGREILVWKRVEHVETLRGHAGEILQLMVVGKLLFSLDDAHVIRIWDLETMEFVNELALEGALTPTVMLHPATYLNKILVGSEEGPLQLWNVHTMTCVHTFQGWHAAVVTMEQSPAVDVVGIGLADGRVVMHHLALDTKVVDFHQEQRNVTALAFRTDAGAPAPFVASGTTTGDIAIWNLESQRLESVISSAHEGAITSLVFLQNEPILLSTGTDNAMRMWIFDHLTGGTARLLKSREGHKAPPTRIRYYGNNTLATMADGADGTSCQILSAGQDCAFRVFHTAREQQSTEMSQGPVLKKAKRLHVRVEDLKLPPILQFAAMETRERDWANVVTCHENEMAAYVWRFEHRVIGKKVLRQFEPSDRVTPGSEEDLRRQGTRASCVTISSCGNFALVGTIGGVIYKYNMQSSEKRGSYPTAATPKPKLIRGLTLPGTEIHNVEDTSGQFAHNGPISGVVVDALNAVVISAGVDGCIKFWKFRSHEFIDSIDLGASAAISQIELHRDANLLVAASDDNIIRVFDIQTRKLVRRFQGHTHRVTDVQFSPDARWIVSASADATLRFWDLPTAKCIDWVRFQQPVTGLTISPTGEFLATSHVGNVGIYLWAIRSFFTDVFMDSELEAPVELDMPAMLQETETAEIPSEANPEIVTMDHNSPKKLEEANNDAPVAKEAVEPLDPALITLSNAPRAFWESLFHLELIKKRNKPIEPPKAPEKAPFFLQTARQDVVKPTFVPVAELSAQKEPEASDGVTGTDVQGKEVTDGEGDEEEEEEEEEKDGSAIAGWGVGDDDEAWGPEGDDDEGDEDESTAASSKPITDGSRIYKSAGVHTTRCQLAVLLLEVVDEKDNSVAPSGGPPQHCYTPTRFHRVATYLQSLSASSVDVELNTLCMGDFDTEGLELLALFIEFLEEEMATRRHFQVLQAYLNRFLKLYEPQLASMPTLSSKLDSLYRVQQQQWEHLQQLLHNNLCLVQYFSRLQM